MAWPQEYRSETYCLMKLTARPWCLDFTLHGHSFHDLSDGFFPFFITRIRRLWSFIHDRVSSKIVYRTKEDRSIALGNICSERKKVFFKIGDWKAWMIRIVGQKEWKTSSLDRAYLICSSLLRGRHSREERWRAERKGMGGKGKRFEKWKGTPKKPNADCVGLNLVLHPPPQITRPLPLSWSDRTFVSGSRVIRTASRFFFKVTTTSTGQPFIP